MKFRAYGYNLTKDNVGLIKRMLANLTDQVVEVTDLRSYENPVSGIKDILIAYGIQAERKLQNVQCQAKLLFPDADRLDISFGDPEEIRTAREKLSAFRELLNSNTTEPLQSTVEQSSTLQSLNLTEEIPANLTASDVKKLEQQQLKQGRTHWTGITKDGRSIRLTIEPEQRTADINMTFAELYAVMGLVDILRVKELEIVYKSSAVNGKSSNQ